MATKKILLGTVALLSAFNSYAAPLSKNTARLQAMDKTTGTSKILEISVNSEVNYEDFSIVVRKCKTNPPEETPESYAFVDIAEKSKGTTQNIYKGWMISSSPALNPLEHPMYDLWLLECVDKSVDNELVLSEDELNLRDELKTTQQIIENVEGIINVEEPKEDGKPESIINIVDTQVEFNAIEEEKKAKEALEKAQEELLNPAENLENPKAEEIVEEKAEEAKSAATEVIDAKEILPNKVEVNKEVLELLNNDKATDEEKPEDNASTEKTQLIDFSEMMIEE